MKSSIITIVTLFMFVTTGWAQTISISSLAGQGFGWMFRSGETCYAVLPRHVAGEFPQIGVQTAAPVAVGSGTVINPFWPGIDLSVAVIRGNASERCTEKLDAFDASRLARMADHAELVRLSPTGEEERVAISIASRGYLSLEGRVASAGAEIYQGTSGAIAFSRGQPIGMAIESDGPDHVTLMRSEEIHQNVSRYLREQGQSFASDAAPDPVAQSSGFSVVVHSTSVEPVSPDRGVENVLGDDLFVFEPQRNPEIVFAVEGDSPGELRRVRIESPTKDGFSLPRRILVFAGIGQEPADMTLWARGEMAPDGVFDTGPRAVQSADWIKVVIASFWSSGDVAIGTVSFP